MGIRRIGRLSAVMTLGLLVLGTPLTAAAAELSPTTEDSAADAAPAAGDIPCLCATEPLPPGEHLPPDESATPPPIAPEEPAAEPPASTPPDAPAPQEAVVDPTAPTTTVGEEPLETPTDEIPSASPPATETPTQPAVEPPAVEGAEPAVPPDGTPAASTPPVADSDPPTGEAPAVEPEPDSVPPRPAAVMPRVSGSSATPARVSRAPAADAAQVTTDPPAAAAAQAVTLAAPPAPPSAASSAVSQEAPAPAVGSASEELGHAARQRPRGPTAFESGIGVEQTVTAGLAIIAPRGIASTVSVAVEFGRAGNGWAGAIIFNVWLRRQMRERRMSQRQLALRSGVDHSTISRLVHGQRIPSLETASRLARALGRVNGDGDAFAYFARLQEETIFPTTRVEMALRGDDEIDDDDVRRLMEAYLEARTSRRRLRQASDADGDAAGPPNLAAEEPAARFAHHRRARHGPNDASG